MKLLNDIELQLYPIDYPFEHLSKKVENGDFYAVNFLKSNNAYLYEHSKFIELSLMRLPYPIATYLIEMENGKHIIFNNVGLIYSINDFLHDRTQLTGMSFADINGKNFSEFDDDIRSDIKNTTLRCIVLRNSNKDYAIDYILESLEYLLKNGIDKND